MSEFRHDVGAAALLGLIGGVLHGREEVADIRPVISGEHGSHEIVAMDVETIHGRFRVTVEPRD